MFKFHKLDNNSPDLEALAYDAEDELFYLVREAQLFDLAGDTSYRAQVIEGYPDEGAESFVVTDTCVTELTFPSSSKGIEGASVIRVDGSLFLLGLCEGNSCLDGDEGRDKGSGTVVVMQRAVNSDDKCFWSTIRTVQLPIGDFEDYSAMSIHADGAHVAVTAKVEGKGWVGLIDPPVGSGDFDIQTFEFVDESDDSEYFFPPTTETCKQQYCNVEVCICLWICVCFVRIDICLQGDCVGG